MLSRTNTSASCSAVSSQRRRSGPLKRSARDAAGGSPRMVDLDRGAGSPSKKMWVAAPGFLPPRGSTAWPLRKCGSPPQVSSTSGFRRLATARGGLGDPLLHFGHRPAAAAASGARPRQPLPALSPSRHSIVLTVFGGRLLDARAKTVTTLATTISPGRRQTTDAIRNRLPDPAPQPERNQAVRSSAARSARRRPRSPRPAGRRCRPARSCGHRSDAAHR